MKRIKVDNQINVRVSDSLFARIQALADKNHWSISKTIRKILEGVLEDTL